VPPDNQLATVRHGLRPDADYEPGSDSGAELPNGRPGHRGSRFSRGDETDVRCAWGREGFVDQHVGRHSGNPCANDGQEVESKFGG
jgi:hypothetical protein